jgi:hypothetical protein
VASRCFVPGHEVGAAKKERREMLPMRCGRNSSPARGLWPSGGSWIAAQRRRVDCGPTAARGLRPDGGAWTAARRRRVDCGPATSPRSVHTCTNTYGVPVLVCFRFRLCEKRKFVLVCF